MTDFHIAITFWPLPWSWSWNIWRSPYNRRDFNIHLGPIQVETIRD